MCLHHLVPWSPSPPLPPKKSQNSIHQVFLSQPQSLFEAPYFEWTISHPGERILECLTCFSNIYILQGMGF
uniref:Uncharacterized protein n=1 Tax=Lepeophtheirus salmonis TaxID=72036 RepID=A0A0K2UYQ7_LEPSM